LFNFQRLRFDASAKPNMTSTASQAKTRIGVVMGSSSDWDTMQHAVQILQHFGIDHEAKVVSAHRMPDEMFTYAETALERGLMAIIAGAGGAAHMPGMLAAKTVVPVLGVPVASTALCKCPKAYLWPPLPLALQARPMPLCLLWPCWRNTTMPCKPSWRNSEKIRPPWRKR
jgi:hypothetical protein